MRLLLHSARSRCATPSSHRSRYASSPPRCTRASHASCTSPPLSPCRRSRWCAHLTAADFVERNILVCSDIRWEAKYAFRNDVLADLLGTATHAIARGEQQALLNLVQLRIRGRIDDPAGDSREIHPEGAHRLQ